MDLSDSHYADLMAQKKRLQQLESEYALKIQKLKEAQALRQAAAPIIPCSVSQPSLHDLTQDKLTLASDDPGDDPDPEGAETQPADTTATTTTGRRRSFRESGSFTKPNLSHVETPATPTTPTTPTVSAKQATPPAELLLFGLNVEDLRLRYQQCEMLPELLTQELRSQGGALLDIRPSDRVRLGQHSYWGWGARSTHRKKEKKSQMKMCMFVCRSFRWTLTPWLLSRFGAS